MPTNPFGSAIAVLLSTGCSNDVLFYDEYGRDDLHTPYAAGSTIRITAEVPDRYGGSNDLSIEADDALVDVGPTEVNDTLLSADIVSPSAGTATVAVYAGSKRLQGVNIEFVAPDAAQLVPAALELLGRTDVASVSTTPLILVDGTATFRVRLMHDGERAFGEADTVTVTDGPDDAQVLVDENYDPSGVAVTIAPTVVGAYQANLRVNEGFDVTLDFEAVPFGDVTALTLYGQDETLSDPGTTIGVTAVGTDPTGRAVYGITPNWTVAQDATSDGKHPQTGEVFWYDYDPEVSSVLQGRFGDTEDVLTIHGVPPTGCRCAAGGGSGQTLLIAGGALAMLLGRRRQPPASQRPQSKGSR